MTDIYFLLLEPFCNISRIFISALKEILSFVIIRMFSKCSHNVPSRMFVFGAKILCRSKGMFSECCQTILPEHLTLFKLDFSVYSQVPNKQGGPK